MSGCDGKTSSDISVDGSVCVIVSYDGGENGVSSLAVGYEGFKGVTFVGVFGNDEFCSSRIFLC